MKKSCFLCLTIYCYSDILELQKARDEPEAKTTKKEQNKMTNYTREQKAKALADYLGESVEHIGGENYETESGREYFILTDEEATEKAWQEIYESLWAFNSDFIVAHMNKKHLDRALNGFEYIAAQDMIRKLQENECENANGVIACMIDDLDQFTRDAIAADGRGHFLASYDGDEVELVRGELFAYRVN